MTTTDIETLKDELGKHENVLVFVGTEINTLNSKEPIYVQGRPSSRRFAHRASSSCHSNPGRAHLALVQLHRAGIIKCMMTENTDGMLLKAGADEDSVIEINGNVHTEECLGCGLSFVREFCVQTSHCGTRECQICGGKLRDTVIGRNESPDMVLKEAVSQIVDDADYLLIIGNVPTSPQSTKYFLPYISSKPGITCVSTTNPGNPGNGVKWLNCEPSAFCTKLCNHLNIEVNKYQIHRCISLIISKRQDNMWLIRTNAITSGGRSFSCLKGVDVIPCRGDEELDEDPEILCYDPFQCTLPMSGTINSCDIEIYYLFFGFNQEPEWSIRVPMCESSHTFNISCAPGDLAWQVLGDSTPSGKS